MRILKQVLRIFTVATLVAVTVPAAQAMPEAGGRDAIRWHPCQLNEGDEYGKALDEAGVECADVTVPLDYARPRGRTITVAISRLPATDTKRKAGVLLLNSGGPGGTGIDMPPRIKEIMGDVGGRYDLIGMDPRFVGRSTPIDCGWPTASQTRSAGVGREGFDRSVALARSLAAKCGQRALDVLPYVSTRNTARDMDRIRALLGERKLSYLGYSYGTYLGAVYAEMFPHRVGRMVLDGPMNPDTYSPRLLQPAGAANEAALRSWAAWAAERNDTYRLGATQDEVVATVHRVIAAAGREPLRVGDFRLDDTVVPVFVFIGLGNHRTQTRIDLAEAVRVLADAAEQGSAQPTEWLAFMMRAFLTEEMSAYGSAEAAILCGDIPMPAYDPESYWRDIERSRAELPFAGPLVNNINACAFWPVRPQERPTEILTDVPALIVAATGDPRTLYPNAKALQGRLTKARLLTLEGAITHGVYGEAGSPCADAVVNAYLDSGRLPARDLACES